MRSIACFKFCILHMQRVCTGQCLLASGGWLSALGLRRIGPVGRNAGTVALRVETEK